MIKRPLSIFAMAGLAIPIMLISIQSTLSYFQPEYIGLDTGLVLFLWPSSIMTMGLHGEGWTLSTVLIFSTIISINGLLYLIVGFVFTQAGLLVRNRALSITKVLLGVGVGLLLIVFVTGMGRPMRYEFPEDYRGWVVIEYSNPACQPLQVSGLYRLVKIPLTGHTCTSSDLPNSDFRATRYDYVGLDGRRKRIPSFNNEAREIWAGHTTVFQTEKEGFPQQGIFVGTAAEYARNRMMPYRARIPHS